MTEALEKEIKRCRTAHLWAGVLNFVICLAILAFTGLVYVCKALIPIRLQDPDLSQADRDLIVHNQGLLDWCVVVLLVSLGFFLFLTFLAFHVRWCIKAGRFYWYCHVASWLQALNAPVGTPAGVLAVKILASAEGRAHFGLGSVPSGKVVEAVKPAEVKSESGGKAEIARQAHESETQD